ncbi:MAG: hypothetical protein H6R01_1540 [Burkholderiaceae bacterium]|nr:hypothetical protein [Burkholderiaceae bacterium]
MSVSDRFFSLVPDRQCGSCMVCCEYLYINSPTLKKPADVLCSNCVINQGCSIYETRPSVCRTWHCLWRRDAAIPEALRPDKSGVLFSLKVCDEPRYLFENAYIVCMAMKTPTDFDTPQVAATLDRYIAEGVLPVWLSHGGGKTLAWPDAPLANAILSPKTAQSEQLANEGQIWLERYEAMLEPLQAKNARFNHHHGAA